MDGILYYSEDRHITIVSHHDLQTYSITLVFDTDAVCKVWKKRRVCQYSLKGNHIQLLP
jgi:hypothetical protein